MNNWKIYSAVLVVIAMVGAASLAIALDQSEVCNFPNTGCNPTGAHAKHSPTCSVCHKVVGTLSFDPAGPAYNASYGNPAFNASTKSCSNVACHTVAPGTFSYYAPGDDLDGDGYPDPVLRTVHYGSTTPTTTPSWYSTGAVACTACHGNPPYPSTLEGPDTWHSSYHANNQNVGPINPNACELCHNSTAVPYGTWVPVAFSAVGTDGKYHGYQINPGATGQHANGTATVSANFRSVCFNCH